MSPQETIRALTDLEGAPHEQSICALLEGGSRLYGLSNENSDVDLRGVFGLSNPSDILGLNLYDGFAFENFVSSSDELDVSLYDLRKFLFLLSKTNTQVMEMLWAEPDDFLILTPTFAGLMLQRNRLVDPHKFYKSLVGYIQGERRLMSGERTGQLGGKRVAALKKYGYSYKNLVQILRLSYCGYTFFTEGYYPVNLLKDELSRSFRDSLMDIKEEPERYNLEQANKLVDESLAAVEDAYTESQMGNVLDKFRFDREFADVILFGYYTNILTSG